LFAVELRQGLQEPLNKVLGTSLTCLRMGSQEVVAAVLDMWDTGIVSVLSGLKPEQGAQQALLHLAPYLEAYLKVCCKRS
jgi:hypothetical protein